MSESTIETCASCGARNRLRPLEIERSPQCGRCGAALPWKVTGTDANWATVTAGTTPILVDFWAPWCAPCKALEPILDRLARKAAGNLKIVTLDIDRNPTIRSRYRVEGIPALVLVRDGEIVDRWVGVRPLRFLEEVLRGAGVEIGES